MSRLLLSQLFEHIQYKHPKISLNIALSVILSDVFAACKCSLTSVFLIDIVEASSS